MRGKVALSGMAFYGYHGYYVEENKLGNHYTVDLVVETEFTEMNDELNSTINYENLYKATEAIMMEPLKLIETLAFKIASSILKDNNEALKVKVKVIKHQPPLGGLCENASVEIELEK